MLSLFFRRRRSCRLVLAEVNLFSKYYCKRGPISLFCSHNHSQQFSTDLRNSYSKKSLWSRSVAKLPNNRLVSRMAFLPPEVKAKLDLIPDVKIDETGKFKYILIKVFATDADGKHVDENSKLVVRGRADCPYHGDIFDKFQEETSRLEGFDDDILGGGRIQRTGNKILVYGYSQGYGPADHTLTVEILKRHYPTHEITWSNEGY